MSAHIADGRRPVVGARAVHRENARIREIAQLRARRAARLANERAAGQRRFLAAAITALATLVVLVLSATSVVAWAWLALPAGLLVASLAVSRLAAIRSEAAGRAEDARLRDLREGLSAHHRAQRHEGDAPTDRSLPEESGAQVSAPRVSTPEVDTPSTSVSASDTETAIAGTEEKATTELSGDEGAAPLAEVEEASAARGVEARTSGGRVGGIAEQEPARAEKRVWRCPHRHTLPVRELLDVRFMQTLISAAFRQ